VPQGNYAGLQGFACTSGEKLDVKTNETAGQRSNEETDMDLRKKPPLAFYLAE
jgi:hypothetical protein